MIRNILVSVLFLVSSVAQAGDRRFFEEAVASFNAVLDAAEDCGLTRLDAYDPRLPWPRTPADEAIVNAAGVILAYTNYESYGDGNYWEFKAWNGGYSHGILFGSEGIKYKTPYGGVVAAHDRFLSPAGWHYRFRCRIGGYVPYETYQACIARDWYDVILAQLCGR